MNKAELAAAVAEETGLTKKDAERALTAALEAIEAALRVGDRVTLAGFGSFSARERAARRGRNPLTGQEIDIPAARVPTFKAGKLFRDSLSA